MLSKEMKFDIFDFYKDSTETRRIISSFEEENIFDSYLVDSIFLLRFLTFEEIAKVVYRKYEEELVWLDKNPTPGGLRQICRQFNVLVELGNVCTVFLPLGTMIDKPSFELSIPNMKFEYKYILDCNMAALLRGADINILSFDTFDFRPLLTLRRLLLDCIMHTGTDIHFLSSYENKKAIHKVQYRIQRELHDSSFKVDGIFMQKILNKLIALKSTSSAIDLDSMNGITTDVSNIFNDDTIDLRITGSRVSAGFYIVIAIQQINTTSKLIDELGFFEEDVNKLRYLAGRNEGLILNTGKMRSGKNTTIFAMLNEKIKMPIRIIEYSNPVEVRMNFPQINYKGDIPALKNLMRLAKKEDIDYAVLNEIPNSEVAFAVRDLVNSAIGVITTTHLNRVYHLPYKLEEFYGKDYKNMISQLTAVINHRMVRRQVAPKFIQHTLDGELRGFEKFAYDLGVREYYEPEDPNMSHLELQPIVEILLFDEELKTALLNHTSLYESEQLIKETVTRQHETIEDKIVRGINEGIFNLHELYSLY